MINFKNLMEEKQEKEKVEIQDIISFIFYDGTVPDIYTFKIRNFDDFFEEYQNKFSRLFFDYCQLGPVLSFATNDYESRTIHIPDTKEFVNDDPEGTFTLYKELCKKLV